MDTIGRIVLQPIINIFNINKEYAINNILGDQPICIDDIIKKYSLYFEESSLYIQDNETGNIRKVADIDNKDFGIYIEYLYLECNNLRSKLNNANVSFN